MGGIADYSGSLVLQMPIAEACHVALQRHPVDKQQLWKHIQVLHTAVHRVAAGRPCRDACLVWQHTQCMAFVHLDLCLRD